MAHNKKLTEKEVFNNIINILKDLHKKYPVQGVARHISDATVEYGHLWGIENKELLFALTKYQEELDMNISQDEVDNIIKGAKDLDTLMNNNEDPFYEEDEF